MSSEALEPPFGREQILGRVRVVERGETTLYERALLAEVARLEQERRDLKRWNTRVGEQLAVAREREQRLREAVTAWDNALSSYCDGPERDAVRAALVDEPAAAMLVGNHPKRPGEDTVDLAEAVDAAAATLAEPEGVCPPETTASTESRPGRSSGSASAAADEPGETPCG